MTQLMLFVFPWVVLSSYSQYFMKRFSTEGVSSHLFFAGMLFISSVAVQAFAYHCGVKASSFMPCVSFVQLGVLLIARIHFKEKITSMHLLGVAFVMAGGMTLGYAISRDSI